MMLCDRIFASAVGHARLQRVLSLITIIIVLMHVAFTFNHILFNIKNNIYFMLLIDLRQ